MLPSSQHAVSFLHEFLIILRLHFSLFPVFLFSPASTLLAVGQAVQALIDKTTPCSCCL